MSTNGTISAKLASMGITLPVAAKPVAAYIPARRVGTLVYVSGQLPMVDGKLTVSGPVPSAVSVEAAKAAARQCALNAIAAAAEAVGGVDHLRGVVRVGAWVASDAGFTGQPGVVNGASELLAEVFGEAGKHARAAVGTNVLPLGASVEVEVLFEV
jgi:enamine deaminase RidA (YjgF/YER057c/UK114 family)